MKEMKADNELIPNYKDLHRHKLAKSELMHGLLDYFDKKLKSNKTKFDVWVDSQKMFTINADSYEEGENSIKGKIIKLAQDIETTDKEVIFSVYKGNSQHRTGGKVYVIADNEISEKQTTTLTGIAGGNLGLDGLGSNSLGELIQRRTDLIKLELAYEQEKQENARLREQNQELENTIARAKNIVKQQKKRLSSPTPTTQAVINGVLAGAGTVLAGLIPQMQGIAPALGGTAEASEEQDPYEAVFGQDYEKFSEIAEFLEANRNALHQLHHNITQQQNNPS